MSKAADYLQDHIVGDVSTSPDARRHFASDSSVLAQVPQIVVAPKNEQDVRKTARFAWQLAERGRFLPIVPRGAGTDMSGAAIGQAISISYTPYMNKVIEFDDRKNTVVVEPGATFGRMQHILTFSHGRFVPSYPMSYEYSTLGGAVASNAGGERSLHYGPTSKYVQKLRVVLANGELIETGRLSKREVGRKMGQPTFEGELYRALDALLDEKSEVISSYKPNSRSNAGYNLSEVRDKSGSMDLTQLFVGSQGTLGLITSATLSTESYSPNVSTILVILKDFVGLDEMIIEINKHKALTCEFYDQTLLALARKTHSSLFQSEMGEELPAGILLVELPGMSKKAEQKFLKKFEKQVSKFQAKALSLSGEEHSEVAHRLKRLPHLILSRRFGTTQPVPGIDDASIPPSGIPAFLNEAYELFKKNGATVMVTGHIAEGVVHAYPLYDLSQLGDRQRLTRLIEAYYRLVLQHGGSVSAEHGDGRIRGAFLKDQLGDVLYEVMVKVKQICDPYGIMNPGVKIGVEPKSVAGLLRHEYEIPQLFHH